MIFLFYHYKAVDHKLNKMSLHFITKIIQFNQHIPLLSKDKIIQLLIRKIMFLSFQKEVDLI